MSDILNAFIKNSRVVYLKSGNIGFVGIVFLLYFKIFPAYQQFTDQQNCQNHPDHSESFGLIIFVYALGLQVGPGFFSSFRKGGVTLNMLAIAVVILGTFLAVVCSYTTGVSLPNMVGILCGATTNTPALGAAQQTLKQMGLESSTPALGCAVAYPLGVIGVIQHLRINGQSEVPGQNAGKKDKGNAKRNATNMNFAQSEPNGGNQGKNDNCLQSRMFDKETI